MSEEEKHQETFWLMNHDNPTEVRAYVKAQPDAAARDLFNLRLETTNQCNAIAHLSRCASRARAARDAAEKSVEDERATVRQCEQTIADLRERLDAATKRAKKGGAR